MTRTGCVGEMIGFGAFDVLFVEMLIGLLIGLLIGSCGGGVPGT